MGPFWSATIFTLFLIFSCTASSETEAIQTYIVSVENTMKPTQYSQIEHWYRSILSELSSSDSSLTMYHIYKTVFEGFSAKLTPQQAQELEKRPEILKVFPQHIYNLQTTRTPDFLGLRSATSNSLPEPALSEYGADVIIGMLDTGIWPELDSFQDEGLGPIPSKWKGECQGGWDFPKTLCNKKLIGARYFFGNTTRDNVGHGTHTASTAAGKAVNDASFLGFARGTAVGMAPKSRLAMYKVCDWGCSGADILAGFDKAVEDGVDVVSVSLGSFRAMKLSEDEIAIGSFGAMEKGVIVSTSAGNSGPVNASVCNIAPWFITVGASTVDRKFPSDLLLEGGGFINGVSLFNGTTSIPEDEYRPLIYAGNASLNGRAYCVPHSLDENLVRGKIVVCDPGEVSRAEKGLAVQESGGVGVIVADIGPTESVADYYVTPGLSITEPARRLLFDYITTSRNPRAIMVFRGTQIGVKPAPTIASFSSRGPNTQSMYVMKPDVIAPGVDILAGWPKNKSLSHLPNDTRRSDFILMSGTSMACPHISGIAALLKGMHTDWSPAMIKSAIMTTAYTHDQDGNPLIRDMFFDIVTAWEMGSGHVDPQKARDPGLVYDTTPDDYLIFLCASNLTEKEIKIITRKSVKCRDYIGNPWDLNYPAISVGFEASNPNRNEIVVKRTVTHVFNQTSSYRVKVTAPKGVQVTVDPQMMVFQKEGEKLSYTVKIVVAKDEVTEDDLKFKSEFGKLVWADGTHQVTSPLVVTWYIW